MVTIVRSVHDLDKSAQLKLFFSFLNQSMCYGYSKDLSHEAVLLSAQSVFKLMGKIIITILHPPGLLNCMDLCILIIRCNITSLIRMFKLHFIHLSKTSWSLT